MQIPHLPHPPLGLNTLLEVSNNIVIVSVVNMFVYFFKLLKSQCHA